MDLPVTGRRDQLPGDVRSRGDGPEYAEAGWTLNSNTTRENT